MSLISGLYGKMPAHGDFVRRGWDDAMIAALDDWFGDAVSLAGNRDAGENSGAGATIARFWIPAGPFGGAAVHLAAACSHDRVGRGFALAVGVAGAGAWRHANGAGGARLEAVLRAAVSGQRDADATLAAVAAVAATAADPGADHGPAPDAACWWQGDRNGTAERIDGATLAALLRERTAA